MQVSYSYQFNVLNYLLKFFRKFHKHKVSIEVIKHQNELILFNFLIEKIKFIKVKQ